MRSRLQKYLPISIQPSRWTRQHLAVLNIRLEYEAEQFYHAVDSVSHDRNATSGLDIRQLEPLRQLELSVAGDVDPDDIGLQQESVLYQVFRGSHLQEVDDGPTTDLRHNEWATGYVNGIISYLFSEVFVGDHPVYGDNANGVQTKMARSGMLRLIHESLGTGYWAPRATLWKNCYPILAVVATERPGFFQEAGCLVSLAQETFSRSRAINFCWPALISITKSSAHLVSMKFTRAQLIQFRRTDTTRISCNRDKLVMKVHRRWEIAKHSGRAAFVRDMAAWLDEPVVELEGGKAASLMHVYGVLSL